VNITSIVYNVIIFFILLLIIYSCFFLLLFIIYFLLMQILGFTAGLASIGRARLWCRGDGASGMGA
jgi:hypothetical protein